MDSSVTGSSPARWPPPPPPHDAIEMAIKAIAMRPRSEDRQPMNFGERVGLDRFDPSMKAKRLTVCPSRQRSSRLQEGYCETAIERLSLRSPSFPASFAKTAFIIFAYNKASTNPGCWHFKLSHIRPWKCTNCRPETENPTLADFFLGKLDDPNAIKPESHVYTSSAVSWCHVDDLPQHTENAPILAELWNSA